MMRKMASETTLMEQLLHHYKTNSSTESITEADRQQFVELVQEALNSLTPQRKKIYEMAKKEKKSHEEIARELNISPNTVKTHMYQTMGLLKEFILEKIHIYIFLALILNFL